VRVVGISPAHDSSVAVYCDGNIELFLKEERFSGVKRDSSPFISLDIVKQNLQGPVDAVVMSSPTEEYYNQAVLEMAGKTLNAQQNFQFSHLHHLSHASLAFYNSGFEEAAVLVADRNGSFVNNIAREAESIYSASYPNNFIEVYKNYWLMNNGVDSSRAVSKTFNKIKKKSPECEITYNSSYSVTKVYETATVLIQQDLLENGKTMGLAAYGCDSDNFPALFTDKFPIDNYFTHVLDIHKKENAAAYFSFVGKETKDVTPENFQFYADYAFQVQKQCQDHMCKLIEKAIEKTGSKNICITGGFGLNVVANGYYTKKFPDINFYFEPLADDSGNSLGAAMYIYRENTADMVIRKLQSTSFHGFNYDVSNIPGVKSSYKDIANILNDQKSVAIFSGNAEAGPRALGNRSILFDARNVDGKEIVNKIKNREWYRPFAAVVLEEDAHLYFDMSVQKSPFMTISFDALSGVKDLIPSVIHVDNTCRIQTVSSDNTHLYNLLTEFKKISGIGILLNTSFNLAGQPLVENPQHAIDVLHNSLLDHVWFADTGVLISE